MISLTNMNSPAASISLLYVVLFFVVSSLFTSCSNRVDGKANDMHEASATSEFVTPVDVMLLQPGPFDLELVSNGKLHAVRKTRLSFPFSETLASLHVTNGQQVEAGQLLAALCDKNLLSRLQQAELRFARASLDMEDILLGRGHSLADSVNIPPAVWQMAGVRSGYSEARLELHNVKADLARTRITAPFSGQVAGLETQVHEQAAAGQILCTLIDNTTFLAKFPVMENELSRIAPHAVVQIIPFASPDTPRQGTVQSIDPRVDEFGRVEVTAVIADTRGLLDGMNVKVVVKTHLPQQLVVPRSAVMYRDNLEVLFKYTSGKAEWTYVNILHQNSTHYSVTANPDRVASLLPGDTIIVANNMNLAHGSLVSITNP
jgi:membrane fusion protein, multidrug efflux system